MPGTLSHRIPEPSHLLTRDLLDRLEALAEPVLRMFSEAATEHHPEFTPTFLAQVGSWSVFAGEGSPLTQTSVTRLTDEGIQCIEDFYAGRAKSWELKVSPFSDATTMKWASSGAFTLDHFETLTVRTHPIPLSAPPDIAITEVGSESIEFRTTTYRGWCGEDATEPYDDVTDLMARVPRTRRYIAWIEGEPVATAALQLVDGFALFMGASTREPFRGRGAQMALIARRLEDAGDAIPLMTAITGTGSYRNAQRAGFNALFSNAIFVKNPPN